MNMKKAVKSKCFSWFCFERVDGWVLPHENFESVRKSLFSWSYCSFSAFISELILYFISWALSIQTDPYHEYDLMWIYSSLDEDSTLQGSNKGCTLDCFTKIQEIQDAQSWFLVLGPIETNVRKCVLLKYVFFLDPPPSPTPHYNYNGEIRHKWDLVVTFDSGVLLT